MNSKNAAKKVAVKLYSAERALDDALIAFSELTSSLIDATRETRQPFAIVQSPLAKFAECSATLVGVRQVIVAAHKDLDDIVKSLSLQPQNSWATEFSKNEMRSVAGDTDGAHASPVDQVAQTKR